MSTQIKENITTFFCSLKGNRYLRIGFALLFHIVGVYAAFWLAIQLRFDFVVPEKSVNLYGKFSTLIACGSVIPIILLGLHRGIWRFFTLRDCFITTAAVVLGILISTSLVFLFNDFSFIGFPRSTFIITAMIFLAWEVGFRGGVRLVREHRIQKQVKGGLVKRVLLFGSPDQADAMLRQLIRYPNKLGRVVGVVSDSKRHHGQQIRGIRIYRLDEYVGELVKAKGISRIFFLTPLNSPNHIRNVMKAVSDARVICDYQFIPSIDDLASGRLTVDRMRKLAIEDLLYRSEHSIDFEIVTNHIKGKSILVTGAGGSIGSEICRQVLKLSPKKLVLFEASEFALFEIDRELRKAAADIENFDPKDSLIAYSGDVRRSESVRAGIEAAGHVDIIYHAAAYKHVHLMELNPLACFQNNVIGSHITATVAEEMGVKEMVLISTDKAVRPTSLMGASKRLAERALIERPQSDETRFKAVRFGNVLGSSGSVIPIFEKQIAAGGPVTVTTKEVTRYFMTIPEAVELVIAAGALADDRTICVLEMGSPVKIDSLARRMIELSGFVPDIDIPIVYTGLQPGEKEYEELLTDDENVVKTEHDRIWVVKQTQNKQSALKIGDLLEILDEGDPSKIRQFAHENISGSLLV